MPEKHAISLITASPAVTGGMIGVEIMPSPRRIAGGCPGAHPSSHDWWRLLFWDLLITAAWAVMRTSVCAPHRGTLEHFSTFTAPLPFAARLLAPCLAWPLHASGSLTAKQAFLVIDTLGFLVFLSGVRYALRSLVAAPAAHLGSLAIPLMLVPAIFIAAEYPPIFFPYDMTSIAFIAWGLGFALRRKPAALAMLLPFATLNRETAILLPVAWVLLWWDRLPTATLVRTTILVSLAYVVPRALALFLTSDHTNLYGSSLPFVEKGNWIIDTNIGWLMQPANVARWSSLLGFVPTLVLVLYAHFPDVSRRLVPLLAFQLGALFFCGIIDESRIYAEWIVIAGVILAPAVMTFCGAPLVLNPALHGGPRAGLEPISAFVSKYILALMFITAVVVYVCLHLLYNH